MLILTEKPSVASAFAAALGVPRTGSCYENDEYCIVNALGHLLETFAPDDYDSAFKKWTLEALPIIPPKFRFKPIEKTKDQLAVVKKCFDKRQHDVLLLATDAEREGEVIGAEILEYVHFQGHAIAKRFWVSEALTKDVIIHGMETAKPLHDYASYSSQGFARQKADWLVGMNLSRLISLKSGKTLTFGRVQTAVLNAIYEREKVIASFVKEKYFEVIALLNAGHLVKLRLFNQNGGEFPFRFAENNPLVAEITEKKGAMKTGKILSVEKEQKILFPPRLFNLTALQKEAHKKYGINPEKTLEIAQVLYEKHTCMSYPRTPSVVMGDDNVDLVKNVFDTLKNVYPDFSSGCDESLISGDNKRLFNTADLADHHALIPLAPLPKDATEDEKNVFELVVKRFFTTLKPPYSYNAVSVTADIHCFDFRGKGIEVLSPGWKTEQDDDDEEDSSDFSGLTEGKDYPVTSVSTEEKYTEPKKHYTYAAILSLMENPRSEDGKHLAGLGTPATRGAILKKLIERKYASEKGKNLLITEDGTFLIEAIRKNSALAQFVSVPETTRWEEALEKDTEAFVSGITEFVCLAVKTTSINRSVQEKQPIGICPACGRPLYESEKNFYCSHWKNGCSFTIFKSYCGAAVTKDDCVLLLSGKKTNIKKMQSKAGKTFSAALYLDKDNKIAFEFAK